MNHGHFIRFNCEFGLDYGIIIRVTEGRPWGRPDNPIIQVSTFSRQF